MEYTDFLKQKQILHTPEGIEISTDLINRFAKDFQIAAIKWSVNRGKSLIGAGCGLGKTLMGLECLRLTQYDSYSLWVSPLGVAQQTIEEAGKFGIEARLCKSMHDVKPGINVTNYDRIQKFDASVFKSVALDECSILKSVDGATRNLCIDMFSRTPYRFLLSATPAPNDYMEIGNYCEFLGIMTRSEMLATFFTHDGSDTSKWVLKGHAVERFWKWVCSWALIFRSPSDLGFSNDGYDLQEVEYYSHVVERERDSKVDEGSLFPVPASSLMERKTERKLTTSARVIDCANTIKESSDQWIVFCGLNKEQELLAKELGDICVSIQGNTPLDKRPDMEHLWRSGEKRVLITKCSMFGYGMNWQHCHEIAFLGLSDSWEEYYQGLRRVWRFGQKNIVNCHFFTAATEGAVVANIKRKEVQNEIMMEETSKHVKQSLKEEYDQSTSEYFEYNTNIKSGKGWISYLGDSVDHTRKMKDNSVHFTVFSPPFSSLYAYTASDRDMGNCRDFDEFKIHFSYMIPELLRVTKPGRLLSFHCMNIPLMKERDGVIGLFDFRGALIKMFVDGGWIFHSEVLIWKNPVTQMQRTKAIGLLHKQVVKDSSMSRNGLPDYLVTMRKPGVNTEPIAGGFEFYVGENDPKLSTSSNPYSIEVFQNYASPVWFDIDEGDTLSRRHSLTKDPEDQRHICPLQIGVIKRALHLYTNPSDLVYDPFGGIGSTGVASLEMGRKAELCELKPTYWKQGLINMKDAELNSSTNLFQGAV